MNDVHGLIMFVFWLCLMVNMPKLESFRSDVWLYDVLYLVQIPSFSILNLFVECFMMMMMMMGKKQ